MKSILSIVAAIFIVGYIIIGLLLNNGFITYDFFIAALYAGGLNLVNVVIALVLFEKFKNESNSLFMMATLGGMTVRLFFLLGAILLLIKVLNVDKYGLILVFFVYYFCLLLVEIGYFYKQSRKIVREKKA